MHQRRSVGIRTLERAPHTAEQGMQSQETVSRSERVGHARWAVGIGAGPRSPRSQIEAPANPILDAALRHSYHQCDAAVCQSRPWWNAQKTAEPPTPVVQKLNPIARLGPIARPHRCLIGIKTVAGTRNRELETGKLGKIAAHHSFFRSREIVEAELQKAIDWKKRQFSNPAAAAPYAGYPQNRRISVFSASVNIREKRRRHA